MCNNKRRQNNARVKTGRKFEDDCEFILYNLVKSKKASIGGKTGAYRPVRRGFVRPGNAGGPLVG